MTNLSHIPFPDVLTQKVVSGKTFTDFFNVCAYVFPPLLIFVNQVGGIGFARFLPRSSREHFDCGSRIPFSRSLKSCEG